MVLTIIMNNNDEYIHPHHESAIAFLVKAFLQNQFSMHVDVKVESVINKNAPFFTHYFDEDVADEVDQKTWSFVYDLAIQLSFSATVGSHLGIDGVLFIPDWPSEKIGRFYDHIEMHIKTTFPNIVIGAIKLVPSTKSAGEALFGVYPMNELGDVNDKIEQMQLYLHLLFRGIYGMFK